MKGKKGVDLARLEMQLVRHDALEHSPSGVTCALCVGTSVDLFLEGTNDSPLCEIDTSASSCFGLLIRSLASVQASILPLDDQPFACAYTVRVR